MEGGCTGEKPLDLSIQHRALRYQERPPPPSGLAHVRKKDAWARCLTISRRGEVVHHVSSVERVRRAAQVVNCSNSIENEYIWKACRLRRAAVLRRAICALQRAAGMHICVTAGAWARSVSGEEAQRASLYRAGCGRLRFHGMAVHRRKACLLLRAAVS